MVSSSRAAIVKEMTAHVDNRVYGFEPLLCEEPSVLILGSLPGGESLRQGQYYYSNSNRIWKVLCRLTGEPMPVDYEEKKLLLAKYHIAFWDYYESAIRPGSDDKDIRDARANDIVSFLLKYPTIKVIAINGFGKYKAFGGQIKKELARGPSLSDVRVLRLPETSGGNANFGWGNLENLAKEWRQIFE